MGTMTLTMPSNYVEIERDEMEYVDGGSCELAMDRAYLNKPVCTLKAWELKRSGAVKGMTASQIEQEIYAHAVCYYLASEVRWIPGTSWIINHGNPINLDDGGDSQTRQAIYATIWATF
ncbi:hypothetical protein KQI89_05530 [Clostridium sp. MSJ-4]|uniref:Uncharacterized protein n=1 Tax=Clostridium simiarum TaxID=2841506 RepID=A0ABS6F000_9CLOT|nr:hypothetical protein [Clostridium simiarum]MBU5591219.1 hypothetical protein [Clostridium simiarum]